LVRRGGVDRVLGNGSRRSLPPEAGFVQENDMLKWAVIFAVIALVAGLFGFTGIAAGAAGIAKILFVVFLVLFVAVLLFALLGAKSASEK
jgi:uncharacterized membrane protein YtjA (UPF0391 family)